MRNSFKTFTFPLTLVEALNVKDKYCSESMLVTFMRKIGGAHFRHKGPPWFGGPWKKNVCTPIQKYLPPPLD